MTTQPGDPRAEGQGQFLVYEGEDGRIRIDVRLANETVWLTQQQMSELFQTSVPNVSMHVKNIYEEGELVPGATLQKFLMVRQEGSREVQRKLDHYNLAVIISVGYRVKSHMSTRFRIWATQRLKEYIIKGFTLDDERLKNPDQPSDYFEELTRRIQDIRTSVRRFYQKMQDWTSKLDAFLNINDREILTHAGKVSRDMERQLAEAEYDRFNRRRIDEQDWAGNAFDRLVQGLPAAKKEKKP